MGNSPGEFDWEELTGGFLKGEFSKNLINYVLLRNIKFKVMLTEAYLEPIQISMMELFSFPLSHILKTYLI